MRSLFLNFAQALGVVMLADFVSGVVHWLEDAYGSPDTPVVGPILIRPNIVHHHFPRFFTKLSWWQSSWDIVLIAAPLLALASWAGFLTWHLWLFAVVSINANQVHKWSHQTRKENGPVVSFFQDIGIFLSPRQHAIHHSDPKNTFYCPITNLLNPVLEKIRFWNHAEALIERATGISHRKDTSNRGEGPGPAWLAEYAPVRPATVAAIRTSACTQCPRRHDAAHAANCRGTCAPDPRANARTPANVKILSS
ncbi:MAG: fatty acid desaturase CarF family protein [Opitutaceae bacterium]